jgi:hypothetical protein
MTKNILVALALAGSIGTAQAEEISNLWDAADIIFDTRLRYEFVDQQGLPNNAHAATFRSRYGFETGEWLGFKGLVEGESVVDLGLGRYNDTRNGRTTHPVVADAEDTELNRLQIAYSNWGATATIGRQRIILGNSRFVGNVGWRQNEQTFDAARFDIESIEDLRVTYAYVTQVNRIFGDGAANGRFSGDTHLSEVQYSFTDNISAKGYGHWVSLNQAPALSTQTLGLRLDGKFDVAEGWALTAVGEFARQTDFDSNPGNYELDYWHAQAALGHDALKLLAGIENLEGDGTRGFSTPLATLHKFQGFADVFLATPAAGIEDMYASASYGWADLGPIAKLGIFATYHDFTTDQGGADLGNEIDLGLNATLPHGVKLGLKAAFYEGTTTLADRNKVWVQLGYSY